MKVNLSPDRDQKPENLGFWWAMGLKHCWSPKHTVHHDLNVQLLKSGKKQSKAAINQNRNYYKKQTNKQTNK